MRRVNEPPLYTTLASPVPAFTLSSLGPMPYYIPSPTAGEGMVNVCLCYAYALPLPFNVLAAYWSKRMP
ncbi:hypothetical protein K437DRAFT_150075 [Tilletiaria anomala UBC 951]|uniref:Uncharacterized protein n=1 Tax=Tilletiaria anomala (strain ATCC 24038 / CBS 436.72 / UBC 951) TaxID=1037660 RepID=A0A066WFZ1_TILAU|nr:uncharacterized protein K437DRAFT_150075 [Tilletiaria anomala UBC 951]KDN52857.1 hypothetical protein K437DRAFT_150075 [Tilletiaria anomala UBC 951]